MSTNRRNIELNGTSRQVKEAVGPNLLWEPELLFLNCMNTNTDKWFVILLLVTMLGLARAQTDAPAKTNPAVAALPSIALEINQLRERQFVAFDPNFKEKMAERIERAHALGKQVIMREIAGQNTKLSHQILSEIIWLISSTADFKRIDQRLEDLRISLDHPEHEADAEEQDPNDGSWGKGYTEWFFKLIASFGNLENEPISKFRFLDRVNSPEKLTNYFISVSVSDIAHTGVDNEREFNESLSILLRMILRGYPRGYTDDPNMKATLMDLILHRFRDTATGYWGERYVVDGHVQFVPDLSITFHVVSYMNGDIPDMNKVVTTTLAVKDLDFPVGWLNKGRHWDHLNMDVAEIFRIGWPHASEAQKKAIAIELNKMLQWCLTESLRPDGSFNFVDADNSKEESTYYGTSFLVRVGFFDKSKRFWTDQDFPEAEGIRQRIIAYIENHIKSGASGGDYYRGALRQINYYPSRDGGGK